MDFATIQPIIPELFLAAVAMLILVFGAFASGRDERGAAMFSCKLAVFALVLTMGQIVISKMMFMLQALHVLSGMMVIDSLASYSKLLILTASVFTLIFGMRYQALCMNSNMSPAERAQACKGGFEYPVLVMLATVGMMVMVSAADFMTLYMGLELQSLSLYVLAAMKRGDMRAQESGMKYFILGAIASGLFLYGASLIYGFTGTTNFLRLAEMGVENASQVPPGLVIGMIFLLVGLFFKISAAPFHMWTPDVYEGAAKPVVAFFATSAKVAAAVVFMRISVQVLGGYESALQQVIIAAAVLSLAFGAFGALMQRNIKRLMAYSSIGHMGFVLVGLAAGGVNGAEAAMIYLSIYVLMNIGMFAFITVMQIRDKDVEDIDSLAGLGRARPVVAAIVTILMLSMAGIPPLAGFFGKFIVFKAAIAADLQLLAIFAVVMSVVSAFYYLRIIKIIYFDEPRKENGKDVILQAPLGREVGLILGISALFNVALFLAPGALIDLASFAAQSL